MSGNSTGNGNDKGGPSAGNLIKKMIAFLTSVVAATSGETVNNSSSNALSSREQNNNDSNLLKEADAAALGMNNTTEPIIYSNITNSTNNTAPNYTDVKLTKLELEKLKNIHTELSELLNDTSKALAPIAEDDEELSDINNMVRVLQQSCNIILRMIADSSGSQSNQAQQKRWGETINLHGNILNNVNISPAGSSGSVIAFSNYLSIVAPSNDLAILQSGLASLRFQGGGTNMSPAIRAAHDQLKGSTGTAPRVVSITSDFMVGDETTVRADIAALIADATKYNWTLRIVLISVDGIDGINTELTRTLKEQYPDIIQVFSYPNPDTSLIDALNDSPNIRAALCGPQTSNAPSATPTHSPTTTNSTSPPEPDPDIAWAALNLLWLLLLAPGIRKKTLKTDATEEETPPSSDVEANNEKIKHTLDQDDATRIDEIGRHEQVLNPVLLQEWGMHSFTSRPINTYKKAEDDESKLPGKGSENREKPEFTTPPVSTTPKSEPEEIWLVAPLAAISFIKIVRENVLGLKHGQKLEATPQQIKERWKELLNKMKGNNSSGEPPPPPPPPGP